jgi:hypothetical protein
LRALPVSPEVVLRLFNSRRAADKHEWEWIHHRSPGKLELLFRGEGDGVTDIEIWEDAEPALLLFNLDLFRCHYGPRESDLDVGDCGSHCQCGP